MMSASEVYFLLAEAKARGWNVAGAMTAEQLYEHAIELSFEQYGLGADAAAYIAQPGVDLAAAGTQTEVLRRIALQKWIALFGNGPEAYAEWRRTGTPGLTVAPGSVNGTVIPVRVPYASVEQSLNRANYEAAVAANGGDDFNDRVWWDQ